MSQPIKLIIGVSGAVGLPTIRHLVAAGAHVRALTSSEQSAARLRSIGVSETVVGDFRSRDDLRRACDGVEAMLYTPRASLRMRRTSVSGWLPPPRRPA